MGIDHHKQYSHITLMDVKGKKLRSGKVANYRTELEGIYQEISEARLIRSAPGYGIFLSVLEAGAGQP